MPGTPASPRLDSLQAARGIAALGVLVFHSSQATGARVAALPPWLDAVFATGYLGLDFFFVLSGFIIFASHMRDPRTFKAARAYFIKRVLRIFPPYLPISIALLVAFWLAPQLLQSVHGPLPEPSLLSSLLLLPDDAPPALTIAWTLIFEMVFYTVFLVFFVSTRVFISAMVLWCAGILAWTGSESALLDTVFSMRNLEFLMGMGVACLVRKRWGNAPGLLSLLIGVIALGAAVVALPAHPPLVMGACFAAIVFGLVILERNNRMRVPAALVSLGDASYSLYLTHNPVQSIISRVIPKVLATSSWWLAMALAIAGSIAAAFSYHRYFEAPVIGALGRLVRRAPPPLTGKSGIPLRESP